jgi:hypothetical protein
LPGSFPAQPSRSLDIVSVLGRAETLRPSKR